MKRKSQTLCKLQLNDGLKTAACVMTKLEKLKDVAEEMKSTCFYF